MKPIQDQFTNLPISRQQKYQLRRAAKGLCHTGGCKKKAHKHSVHCKKHWVQERERMRKKLGCVRRFKTCLSYR